MATNILTDSTNSHESTSLKFRHPATKPDNAIIWTTRIATICAGLVILAAGVLGYTALRDLFVSIGLFAAWMGLLFPLLFDLAEVTAAVSVLNARLQGEDDRFAWCMVLLFTVLGIVANIGHATRAFWTERIDPGQFILAVFATSLFPLSVALVTHLLKRVITRDIKRRQTVTTLAELTTAIEKKRQQIVDLEQQKITVQTQAGDLTGKVETLKVELAELRKKKRKEKTPAPAVVSEDTEAQARQILAEWLRNGRRITGSGLGRALGKSERLGRELKKRLMPEVESAAALVAENGNVRGTK